VVEPIKVINLQVNQWSQINEDTDEPSVNAQDINPIVYMPEFALPNFAPGPDSNIGQYC